MLECFEMCWWWPFAAVMLDGMRRTAIQTVPLWMLGGQTAGLMGNILRGTEDEEWREFLQFAKRHDPAEIDGRRA